MIIDHVAAVNKCLIDCDQAERETILTVGSLPRLCWPPSTPLLKFSCRSYRTYLIFTARGGLMEFSCWRWAGSDLIAVSLAVIAIYWTHHIPLISSPLRSCRFSCHFNDGGPGPVQKRRKLMENNNKIHQFPTSSKYYHTMYQIGVMLAMF